MGTLVEQLHRELSENTLIANKLAEERDDALARLEQLAEDFGRSDKEKAKIKKELDRVRQSLITHEAYPSYSAYQFKDIMSAALESQRRIAESMDWNIGGHSQSFASILATLNAGQENVHETWGSLTDLAALLALPPRRISQGTTPSEPKATGDPNIAPDS